MPDSSQLGALTLAVEIKYCDSETCHICSVILRILFFRIIFWGGEEGGGGGVYWYIYLLCTWGELKGPHHG